MEKKEAKTRERDYGADGISIRAAMLLDARTRKGVAGRPRSILWNGERIQTSALLPVPEFGRFRLEFLSDPVEPLQGVDVKADGGKILIPGCDAAELLRTWNDPRFEPSVEYEYLSPSRTIRVWNVYHVKLPNGELVEEKWTENAGMLIEPESETSWRFRCSDGPNGAPDFQRLAFRFSVKSR